MPRTQAARSDRVRIALVQPLARVRADADRNVEDALRYVEDAAERGAQLVAFPETYPGPWSMPMAFDPAPALDEAARRHGIHVQYGTLEPVAGDEGGRRAHNVLALTGPDGPCGAPYRRTHPPGPWIYGNGEPWSFEYVAGDDFPVFETPFATVGLAMCSEVYVPEVTRALAVRGAELILLPAGTDKRGLLPSWRHLIWARAIENLAVVATTQNVLHEGERGLAMVAEPERVVFEATGTGMFVLDVDLERVRALRAGTDGRGSGSSEAVKPGLLSQWRRPELHDRLQPPNPA
jgi:predicted amidohydrolase